MSTPSSEDLQKILNPKSKRKIELPAKKVWVHRLEQILKLAGDTGSIFSQLQNKPTLLNWVGISLKTISMVLAIRTEYRSWKKRYPVYAFQAEKWELVPPEYKDRSVELTEDLMVVEEYWSGANNSSRPIIGKINNELIGWVAGSENPDDIENGPFLLKERKDETINSIGKAMWDKLGIKHANFTYLGIASDPETAEHNLPLTKPFQEILNNIKSYLDNGISRSILIQGPPGSGKSCGAQGIIKSLGFNSFRVDLSTLIKKDNAVDTLKIVVMARAIKPDAVIIDDLDRVGDNVSLLNMLQELNKYCKLVIGTANFPENMISAMLRPQRFDEIIRVDHLDENTLIDLVYKNDKSSIDIDLINEIKYLPIAYVNEFIKRKTVLGIQKAKETLMELKERARLLEDSNSVKVEKISNIIGGTDAKM